MIRRAFAIALILATGCATPIPPSGGPPDQTPPELLETSPEQGAVNVDAQSVRLTFSEHVDQASFAQAFSISPSFDRTVDFRWSGRNVTVRFPEPPRENTTYVLTIDTNLLDIHRVALSSPITYAFSTGPTISAGALSGRVVASRDGAPIAGIDVLAYTRPDSTAPDNLDSRPAYRTQTNSEGLFTFEYLTEQFYYVPALRDENRNLQPDAQEAFATPPAPALFADTTAATYALPWVVAKIDTTPPAPLRAQSSARSRHLVRFSEPIQFLKRDPALWVLADSATGLEFEIDHLFLLDSDPRQVHLITEELGSGRYRIVPTAVADTSGNVTASTPVYITAAQQDDTLRTRFIEFLPIGPSDQDVLTLPRGVEPGLRFNGPISEDLLGSAVSVADTTGAARGFIAVTQNGTVYDILPEPRLQPGERLSVTVDASQFVDADTAFSRSYQRISADETGEIAGVVEMVDAAAVMSAISVFADTVDAAADTSAIARVAETVEPAADTSLRSVTALPIVVQIFAVEVPVVVPTYTTMADSDGSFVFSGLPAGTYRLRAFADVDSSGTWDAGMLMPYRPAEGIAWRTEPVRVRNRWETALPDTLRIPVRP